MTKTTDTTLWTTPSITLPCEHRLFQATPYCMKRSLPRDLQVRGMTDDLLGAWAVADNSGVTPEQTEDGILWLDQRRNIKLDDGAPRIPVLTPDGTTSVFITNAAGLFVISEMFRWNVNILPGNLYRAVRL
jgi:hypothetical protein